MHVVDSHYHLWDPAKRDYPWMDDSVAAVRKRFDVDDFRAVATPLVTQSVVVQAVNGIDETRELLGVAARNEIVASVVGWVDLTAPDVSERLAQLRALPGGQYLAGIRHLVHDEADPKWLLRDDVMRGLEAVADAGLCFDLLVRARELPAATALARKLPQCDFVLDHAAKPDIAHQRWEPWNERLAALAACPNVACKISGLVTEADPRTWRAGDIVPYLQRAVELFTPQRILFGSDWPVCLLAASYAQVVELASAALGELSDDELAGVFSGNARRTYLERAT